MEQPTFTSLGRWDEHELSDVRLVEEVLLRLSDLCEWVRARDHWAHFAALEVADQVLEDLVVLERAPEEGKVLEVQGPQVDLCDWPGDGPRDGVPPARTQDVQQLREARPANNVDHHVDRRLPKLTDQICVAVNRLVGTLGQHTRRLRTRADCDHRGASSLGKLDSCESHTARGSGHQNTLTPDRSAMQHVLRGRVGARCGRQLLVGQIAAHRTRVFRRSNRELREATVALAAERPHLERPKAHRAAQHGPHDDAFADAVARDSLTHLHDTTADIRALNARELQ